MPQGCPLSPTLFAICIEQLSTLIRKNPDYFGINISRIGQCKFSKFPDDTIFFVNDQKDHDIALNCVKLYELGTAAKANVSKTELIPIGPDTHRTENYPNKH